MWRTLPRGTHRPASEGDALDPAVPIRREAQRDQAEFCLLPGVVRTYAPEGRTTVLREKVTGDHLSVMAVRTAEP